MIVNSKIYFDLGVEVLNDLLEVRNIRKKVKEKELIKDLTFNLSSGEIIGLIGANGAGKTTILRALSQLVSVDGGEIKYNGINVFTTPIDYRKNIGTLIETPSFYKKLTGLENIKLFMQLYRKSDAHLINEVTKELNLYEHLNKKVEIYSLGMRQRLALAQLIAIQPKILLLDEPMNGLDPEGMIEFRNILLELKSKGMAILISSHLLSELENVCDRFLFVKNGSVRELNVESSDTISKTYLLKEITPLITKITNKFNVTIDDNKIIYIASSTNHKQLLKYLVDNDLEVLNINVDNDLEQSYMNISLLEE